MAFLPWDLREPGQREFPGDNAYVQAINAATAILCPLATQLNNFQRDILNNAVPGAGVFTLLTGENVINRICLGPPQPRLPPHPTIPKWTQGCRSSGRIRGKVNVSTLNNPFWVDYEEIWDCTNNNVGLPVTDPIFVNVGGSLWAWQVQTDRGDGTPLQPFEISAEVGVQDQRFVVMEEVVFTPCPGCNAPPPTIQPPQIPPRNPDAVPIPRPRFDIDFPINVGLPGLPSIDVSIPYEVVFGVELDVKFPGFVLQPRIDISPSFGVYPTFEFNAGGVSINTGGVNIPINNEFNLIQRGAQLDCERLLDCLGGDEDCTNVSPTVLKSGTSTIGERVFYANFQQGTYRYVSVSILGNIPKNQAYYQTNEATGYFGSIAATANGATFDQVEIYNREAAVNLKDLFADGVRLFLKPGLQFQIIGWSCNG